MREFKPILGIDEINKSRLLNITVLLQDGKETVITLSLLDQVKQIKERILGDAAAKDLQSYKVVSVSNKRVLEDQRTLEQENVKDDDTLLVCTKRKNIVSPFRKPASYSSKGPDAAHIKKCTEFLVEEKGTAATSPGLAYAGMFDFFGELKRILISLTEVACLVQHVNGEENDEETAEQMDTDDTHDVQIDPLLLKKLTDMGFTEARGRKALILNRMCPMQAMEWLLQHENDDDIDKPLTADEIASFAPERTGRRNRKGGNKKREFVASPAAIKNLKEMGFEEKDILEALKLTRNNQERALDWLLGDRQLSDQNPDGGLEPGSPLYTAIMDHPVVQLGMTNPRILHAFEDMLENPNNSGQYINDPEIGPVLLQISRIVQSFSR